MSAERNNGGPAFPVPGASWDGDKHQVVMDMPEEGMTLRDYFAAKALRSVYAPPQDHTSDAYKRAMNRSAQDAYALADAMLKARQQ